MTLKMLKNVLLTAAVAQLLAFGTVRTVQAATVTLAATQNASLSTTSGNSTDSTEVYVGSGSGVYNIALQWDLSGVATAYPGYQITGATLSLYTLYKPSTASVVTTANLLNPAAGNPGIVSATATWNILNGNPSGYNYYATKTSSSLGQYSINPAVGDTLISNASASDLTILNQRLTESLGSDQYALLQMAAATGTGTWNVGFQNNTLSLAASTYHLGAAGSGPGIAPTLTLTLSPVPEPGTFALAGFGGVIGLCMAWRARRRAA